MSQNFKTAILNHIRWVYRAVGQTHTSSTQVRKRKLVWACRIRGMAGEKQNHLESNWNIDEVGWDIGSQVFHSFPLSRLLHSTYPVVYVSRRIGIRLNLCRGEGQGNTLLYKNAASSFCRLFQGHYSDSNTQGLRLSSLYSRHIFSPRPNSQPSSCRLLRLHSCALPTLCLGLHLTSLIILNSSCADFIFCEFSTLLSQPAQARLNW